MGGWHLPLDEWLIEELRTRYDIPRAIATQWAEGSDILPLLDGLAEPGTMRS